MTYEEIEDNIEVQIEQLKPEIRREVDYMFRHVDPNEPGPLYGVQASIMPGMKPSIMIFYIGVMLGRIEREKWNDDEAKDYIRRLISHEITHLFTSKESEANKKQRDNKYFKN